MKKSKVQLLHWLYNKIMEVLHLDFLTDIFDLYFPAYIL